MKPHGDGVNTDRAPLFGGAAGTKVLNVNQIRQDKPGAIRSPALLHHSLKDRWSVIGGKHFAGCEHCAGLLDHFPPTKACKQIDVDFDFS